MTNIKKNENDPCRNWEFFIEDNTKQNLFLNTQFSKKWSHILKNNKSITFIIFYVDFILKNGSYVPTLFVYLQLSKTCRPNYIKELFTFCEGNLTVGFLKKSLGSSENNLREFILNCDFINRLRCFGIPRFENDPSPSEWLFVNEHNLNGIITKTTSFFNTSEYFSFIPNYSDEDNFKIINSELVNKVPEN